MQCVPRSSFYLSVSEEVLMMNGILWGYWGSAKDFGTLVKGSQISSGIEDDFHYDDAEKPAACWNTTTLEESGLTGIWVSTT